jgi:hypothetical protein
MYGAVRHRPARPGRRRHAVVVAALVLVPACGGGTTTGQSLDRLPAAPYGDLQTLVRDLYIPGSGSEGYVAPSSNDLPAMGQLVGDVESRAFDAALAHAQVLGYDLWRLADPSAPDLVVLAEHAASLRGGGTFVFDVTSPKPLVIEVPHPNADAGTLDEGVRLFLRAQAGAMLVAGAHRCADLAATPCTGAEATNACAGILRISDSAHFAAAYFEVAHERLMQALAGSVSVSLHAHANSTGEADLMVSEGTRERLAADSLGNHLRDALRTAGYQAVSCNSSADPSPRLCGESNVQGRRSNGSPDACKSDASVSAHRFLHVEQSAASLATPDPLVTALAGGL